MVLQVSVDVRAGWPARVRIYFLYCGVHVGFSLQVVEA